MSFHQHSSIEKLRNRRGKIKRNALMALGVIAVVAFMALVIYAVVQAQKSCEAQGGVYESDGECEVNGEDLYELD